ncbi:uncharacterized protein PFL1_06453 [Pseudozyma flocculosa PF-1]|uniref:Related to AVL9 - protein involved in exocytic transport from the Golgi n=2 Tax=Pseudozyma flocculosa TaxID=84751 RepID=A0A5C3ETT1_9BASI|nr:uncharacterized protein PFL1_06453 [Pseudozyma flocculosa PF-1]EPQ25998.1 hypothetical protein PFL1_06453 [Pseudozyma flocculosa PF-1]SPO35698.1 related to AVL9 - protein involved in exocytic transport from the Golgi [Pseudozyma flocculosa]
MADQDALPAPPPVAQGQPELSSSHVSEHTQSADEVTGDSAPEDAQTELQSNPSHGQDDTRDAATHRVEEEHEEPPAAAPSALSMPEKVQDALRLVHQAKLDDAEKATTTATTTTTDSTPSARLPDDSQADHDAHESDSQRASHTDSKPTLPSLATETISAPADATPAKDQPLSAPSRPAVPVSPSISIAATDPIILGLAVVDFNHLVGPQVEYAHPKELLEDEDLVKSLPFLALPDGSHLSDEDFCYFHLNCPKLSDSTIFGISCNRQIASDALLKKGAEVTRSTVQKAVVVLAKEPVFGPIREKLGIVTRAFFAQGDLGDVDILVEFHATLEVGLQCGGLAEDRETVMYMGTSIRELVHKWHFKTLMLVKLLLLQRRIMFFGYPVERLCTYQYSLVSLIPSLLLNLQDASDPQAKSQESRAEQAESLRTSDRKSLMKYLGMPLNIFGESSFFQPYCPLQQIDLLQSRSWLVGTSNSIFKQQKDCKIDVVVDLETSTLEFQDLRLQQIVGLTPADRKWMDEIVHTVNETWNPADPTRPTSMGYHGSDDYLRAKFEDYICAMLSSTRYADFLAKSDPDQVSITAPDASSSHHFGTEYLAALRGTNAFAIWQRTTDPMLFDIVDHKHPCEGKTSAIEDVGLRLSAGLHDLRLEENLGPTREAIGSAIQAGGANIYRLASNFRTDFAKFRAAQLAGGVNPMGMLGGLGGGAAGGEDKDRSQLQAATGSGGAASLTPSSASSSSSAATGSAAGAGQGKGTITGEAIDASGRRTNRSSLRPLSLVGGTSLSTTGGAVPTNTIHTSNANANASTAAGAGTTTASTLTGFHANEAMNAASQAAAQAGTQVRAAFGSFGSFLSSRQKAWSASRTPSSSSSVTPAPAPAPSSSSTQQQQQQQQQQQGGGTATEPSSTDLASDTTPSAP